MLNEGTHLAEHIGFIAEEQVMICIIQLYDSRFGDLGRQRLFQLIRASPIGGVYLLKRGTLFVRHWLKSIVL